RTGRDIGAGEIDNLPAVVAAADAGDAVAVDGDVGRAFDVAGEDVDDPGVAKQQIRGSVTAGDGEEVGTHSRAILTHPRRSRWAPVPCDQSLDGGRPPPKSLATLVSPLLVLILPLMTEVVSMKRRPPSLTASPPRT